jgi:6-phosphogluconolactonase
MISLRTFKDTSTLTCEAEGLIRQALNNPGALMLSGGSTPYVIYNRIAELPCPVHPERKLFLSDERMVPADSTSNNAHNLMPMLDALSCHDRFIPVDTTLNPAAAAGQFAHDLQQAGPIDLGFLGMGADGHTAGFFTLEDAARTSGAETLHTNRPDGMQGVSVTPALLHRIERIMLLVTGEAKRDIINTLLTAPQTIPAGVALSGHANVELWTDIKVS